MNDPKNRFAEADTIESLLTQMVGAGSMCWEHVERAGVFDDRKAVAVTDDGIARLIELIAETEGVKATGKRTQRVDVTQTGEYRKGERVVHHGSDGRTLHATVMRTDGSDVQIRFDDGTVGWFRAREIEPR